MRNGTTPAPSTKLKRDNAGKSVKCTANGEICTSRSLSVAAACHSCDKSDDNGGEDDNTRHICASPFAAPAAVSSPLLSSLLLSLSPLLQMHFRNWDMLEDSELRSIPRSQAGGRRRDETRRGRTTLQSERRVPGGSKPCSALPSPGKKEKKNPIEV